jgi:hypothetical protein
MRHLIGKRKTGSAKPIGHYKKFSKLYSGTQLHERTFERIAASLSKL